MSNTDFNVSARERRSQQRTSLSPLAELSIEDLEEAFDALGEEIFLVNRNNGDIVWMSPACKKLTHKLGSTRNIAEVPALKKILFEEVSPSRGTRTHSCWHSIDATWNQYIGNDERSSISVYCGMGDASSIWVRFTRYSDKDDYLRQYIADQEVLFDTSRSISVGEMATTLAHELNQPLGTLLNIVNGIKSRIDENLPESDEIFAALQLAEKQGQFASEILLRVRSFAQSRQPVMGACNINKLILDTLKLLDWKFQAEQIQVRYSVIDDNVVLRGDSTLLQQVLVNLLRNAVESMADNDSVEKRIKVVASIKNSMVSIDISDSGHGIDENNLDDIFTLFRSKKPNGMGVGLNICLSFIELHQGKFWFTQNDSRGSTAHIILPT